MRIVDKFSVVPPTTYVSTAIEVLTASDVRWLTIAIQTHFNRYIGAEFPKVLEKPEVEYRQANLTVACESSKYPLS